MFEELQKAINDFEAAVQAQATDTGGLGALQDADATAQAKVDAANALKAGTVQALVDQQAKIAADNNAIAKTLRTVAVAASIAADQLSPPQA